VQPRTTKARTHEEFTPVVFHSSRRGPQCTRYVDPSKTVTRFAGSIPACIALRRVFLSTGSRTHPWLYGIARSAG